jgi:hypothetical protein
MNFNHFQAMERHVFGDFFTRFIVTVLSVSDKDIVRVFAFFLVIFKLNILISFKSKIYFHFNFSPYFLVCAES